MKAPQLLQSLKRFEFKPLTINQAVDSRKRLAQKFDLDFPLLIRFYSFPGYRQMLGENWLNWHEHLELILPVSGSGKFRVGSKLIDFGPGDLLLVNNLTLHGMHHLRSDHRSMVIYFKSELIYNLGSCACDAMFLSAFWERPKSALPILRRESDFSDRVRDCIHGLVEAYTTPTQTHHHQALCKLKLMEMLYWLRLHFAAQETTPSSFDRQKDLARQLQGVFDHLKDPDAEPLRIGEAATLVGMGETKFKQLFRKATGSTYSQFVIYLRLERAAHLLRTTDLPISEIASSCGFSDQSHLDHQFKNAFDSSPRHYRKQHAEVGNDPVRRRPRSRLTAEIAQS